MSVTIKFRRQCRLLGVGLMALCLPAVAEDIDLFIQPAAQSEGDLPNVLIVLDNTANWNTAFTNEIGALVSTVNNLAPDKFRVGLMLFSETGSPNSNTDGGYVRAAVRPLTADYKTKFTALLNSFDKIKDRSNGGKVGLTMAEAYLYFDGFIPGENVPGEAPRAGNKKVKTDFTSNTVTASAPLSPAGVTASNNIYALSGNALPRGPGSKPMEGTPYNSPVLPDSCAPNFIIYISNGSPGDNINDSVNNADSAKNILIAQANQEGISGAANVIPVSPTINPTNYGDEWARFMKRSPYKITTYAVDVDPKGTGQGPAWTAQLKSMANVSSGKYFAVTSGSGGDQIAIALGNIFAEIQAVNSVFASVSLPLSVSTQGTYLNQLFVGMFRPDTDAMPRWNGNLKQYQLAVLNSQLTTVDSTGADAINSGTGFITDCAVSYWSTADTYWSFRPEGKCTTVAGSDVSNSPDGPITEKGAQAQQLRSTTTRAMKTCTTFACASLVDFTSASVTDAMLGGTAGNKNFQRGIDVNDEDVDLNNSTEMRASAHGDVVHSRPVAINYATDLDPGVDPGVEEAEVVVFYGANDGVLRAVNGNRSAAIGTVPAGMELWSFVPFEFHARVDRLRKNNVPINFQGSTTPGAQPKPYGLDGPLTVYESAGGTQRWLYATARRGGRTLHAFDVSSINSNPAGTTLKWKIGCSNMDLTSGADGCISPFGEDFSRLAQTWSAPKVLKTKNSVGATTVMLMMGGGYDNCEDADPITETCRNSGKGDVVYLIDANSGRQLKQWRTDRPVAAEVFIVQDQDTGLAKYAYVVDLGGNIYRIHGGATMADPTPAPFGTMDPILWTMTKIASLGCDSAAGSCPSDGELSSGSMNRKFLFSVDVLQKPGEGEPYNIMVGSGDREKPLRAFDSALNVENFFFMIKDRPTTADWLTSEEDNCDDQPVICLDSLYELPDDDVKGALTEDQLDDLQEKKGWYLPLKAGEQVVTSAITVFETVTFSTHEPTNPDPGVCEADLGTARVYNIDYASGKSSFGTSDCVRCEEISGGGLPPSPVAGKVILDDGTIVPFIIGADPDSPLQSRQPPETPVSSQPKSLTYWFIER